MGVFTRMRDIISSNINAMLDRAEDPQKLIRLIIQEMEDTLVEIKAACAGAMAQRKRIERELDAVTQRTAQWEDKARLAVDKGREDLAREALLEKRRHQQRAGALQVEADEAQALVGQYQEDIVQLEEKLAAVRERQRLLVHRHLHAARKKKAQQDIRRADSSEVWLRFEHFRNKVERMEAEADLVNLGRRSTLEDEFTRLEGDEEIENELQRLKRDAVGSGETPAGS